MSFFTVKEHLILEAGELDFGLRELLKQRLLNFSMSIMPRGNMKRCELALRAGKQLHAFAGSLPTPEYYGLVQAVGEEEDLEFIAFYEYSWEDWWDQCQYADPYLFTEKCMHLDCGSFKKNFYSLYVADQEDPGELMAFGAKNGRHYQGVVPFVTSDQVPPRGRWFSPVTTVSYEAGNLRAVDVNRLAPLCRSLCDLGGEHQLKMDLEGFHFSLSRLELHTAAQLYEFSRLCRQLRQLTGEKCRIFEEFVELSGADPQMLILDTRNLQAPQMSMF